MQPTVDFANFVTLQEEVQVATLNALNMEVESCTTLAIVNIIADFNSGNDMGFGRYARSFLGKTQIKGLVGNVLQCICNAYSNKLEARQNMYYWGTNITSALISSYKFSNEGITLIILREIVDITPERIRGIINIMQEGCVVVKKSGSSFSKLFTDSAAMHFFIGIIIYSTFPNYVMQVPSALDVFMNSFDITRDTLIEEIAVPATQFQVDEGMNDQLLD